MGFCPLFTVFKRERRVEAVQFHISRNTPHPNSAAVSYLILNHAGKESLLKDVLSENTVEEFYGKDRTLKQPGNWFKKAICLFSIVNRKHLHQATFENQLDSISPLSAFLPDAS